MTADDEWITVAQAGEISGYNEEHIRRLLRDGLIAGRKFGIVWQVKQSSIDAYLAKAQRSEDRRNGPKKQSPEK
jgi:hypothetical protein